LFEERSCSNGGRRRDTVLPESEPETEARAEAAVGMKRASGYVASFFAGAATAALLALPGSPLAGLLAGVLLKLLLTLFVIENMHSFPGIFPVTVGTGGRAHAGPARNRLFSTLLLMIARCAANALSMRRPRVIPQPPTNLHEPAV
jgi:hypothetical protein